jgi:serine/threonine-protein kinase HipA
VTLRGKNAHYWLRDIQRRHFHHTAQKCGLGPDMEAVIDDVLARIPDALDDVARSLPPAFPEELFV